MSVSEILTIVGVIVGICGGLFGIYFYFKKCFKSALKTELIPIQLDLGQIHKDIKEMNERDIRNFLVKFLNDKEIGLEQNEACVRRAYEIKDLAKKHNVNSYIKKTWERVMGEEW